MLVFPLTAAELGRCGKKFSSCCKNLLKTENSEDAGINYATTPAYLVDEEDPFNDCSCALLQKAGDVVKVDEYLDDKRLRRKALFHQMLQALIELAPAGRDERALQESISNYVATRGKESAERQSQVTTAESAALPS